MRQISDAFLEALWCLLAEINRVLFVGEEVGDEGVEIGVAEVEGGGGVGEDEGGEGG